MGHNEFAVDRRALEFENALLAMAIGSASERILNGAVRNVLSSSASKG